MKKDNKKYIEELEKFKKMLQYYMDKKEIEDILKKDKVKILKK